MVQLKRIPNRYGCFLQLKDPISQNVISLKPYIVKVGVGYAIPEQ
jgi:hypothetical protein